MSEHLIQLGMRAAIRDVQEWLTVHRVPLPDLEVYLLAMLITAGAYEDLGDGEG